MKPRIVFRKGFWFCMGLGALGSGCTIGDAWESWRFDAEPLGVPA